VLTNHHCGYGQIQRHSSLENNYLDDGFWAETREEELPNPGLTVTFTRSIEEVTDWVKACLERDKEKDVDGIFFLSPDYLNRIAREKVGEAFLSANPGTVVEIKPFFNGNQYYLFTKKVYSDVRLVGAPPSSIGKFGPIPITGPGRAIPVISHCSEYIPTKRGTPRSTRPITCR